MRKIGLVVAVGLLGWNVLLFGVGEKKSLPDIKDTTISIPVEEFSKFVKDTRISLPWAEFEKFLISEAGIKYIRVPWELFLRYLETGTAVKPPKAPVDYVLSSFNYTGKPEKGVCSLKFTSHLLVLKDPAEGWTTVKLWPASQVFLARLTLNGKPANILSSDNTYQILINEPGNYQLEGEIQVKLSGEYLRFAPVANTSSLLKISLPKDYEVGSYGASTIKTNRTADATETEIAFAPNAGVEINWALQTKEPTESKVLVNALIACYVQPETIKTNVSLRYEILYQPVQFLKIEIPNGVRINNVTGNLLDWKQTDSTIQLELKPQTKGIVNIDVSYEQDLKPDASEVNISSPLILNTEKTTGYIVFTSVPNLEVNLVGGETLSVVDPKEVPGAASGTVLAFRFNRLPFSGILKILRYEELPVLEATADSANAITAVTLDGKTVTRVIFHLRNNTKQFLQVTLPKGSQLWSAYVGENPIKPLAGTEGKVLIPVLKSGPRGNSALPVEVIYYLPGLPFGKSGDFQISLPSVDVPIMHLMYSLYMPEKLRLDNFGGNLEKVESFSVTEETARKVSADATNKPERYLQQQGSLEKNVMAAVGREKPTSNSVFGMSSQEKDFSAGLLPLRIYIPTTGQLLRFEKRLVIKEELTVQATYRLSTR